MSKPLIIVESPTKARTIQKYLGGGYEVAASVGHIKDLPQSDLGIDLEHDFEPKYEVIRGKRKVIQEIRKASKAASHVFLAPDPDREGEAIAWHIADEIRSANPNISRVLFHEITRPAILAALKTPRELDSDKFASQQARRILDRLVGYQISPLLWEKVRRGLSAGRVQSVAVRLVVEREREIEAFEPEEYWTVEAEVLGSAQPSFTARLTSLDGKKLKLTNGEDATAAVTAIRDSALTITNVDKRTTKKSPAAPFTTSKLQQDAARLLRYSPKRTMSLAQRLYEGVSVGDEGAVGLITYMRTDSTRLSDESVAGAREYVASRYGADFLPAKPNTFSNQKRSQDAHEAIRPTSMDHPPERVRQYLDADLFRLYSLIWNRFVACQMAPAVYDKTSVDITAGRYGLRANGSILVFAGYTEVYADRREGDDNDRSLPALEKGETLKLEDVKAEQLFTQPPPRYSEATLIKELEEQGIGRPSTYATIISTIQDKEYVAKKEGRFTPSELGRIVTDLLVESFPDVLDVSFTAKMEDELDRVEEGDRGWLQLLKEFYGGFEKTLARAREEMRNVKRQEIPTDISCELCGEPMVIRFGKNGSFLGCSGYPDCRNTKEYERGDDGKIKPKESETTDETCPKDGAPLLIRQGRFGRFLACTNYPKCKFTKPVGSGAKCPQEGCEGELVEKRSRKGKQFWGCSLYPKCDFASWDQPVAEKCPDCGAPTLFEQRRRGGSKALRCTRCDYRRSE